MAKTKGGFIFGFILGALIGAGIGLIFAPQPGEETREQLKERISQMRSKVGELAGGATEVLRDAIEEGKAAAAVKEAELKERFGKNE